MPKKPTIISIESLNLNNNDLFVRKSCIDLDKDAQLIIDETHSAILIKDGELANTLPSGRHPIFDKHDKNVYQVDVIFMSKTAKLKANWGTTKRMDLRDPKTGLRIEVGANGEYEVQINDPRKFYIELMGAERGFDLEKLKERLQGRLLSELEPAIARTVRENNLSFVDLAEYKLKISKDVNETLNAMFEKEYGLKLYSFIISNTYIPTEFLDKIEDELSYLRKEEKQEKTVKEIAAEIERLSDKQWERDLMLKDLENNNYDKYLEVCKILGWENLPKAQKGQFCLNCGKPYSNGLKFCQNCGAKIKSENSKKVCPSCKKENLESASFCGDCGTKL